MADLTQHGTDEGWFYLATVFEALLATGGELGDGAASPDGTGSAARARRGLVLRARQPVCRLCRRPAAAQASLAASMGRAGMHWIAPWPGVSSSACRPNCPAGSVGTRQSLAAAIYTEGFYNRKQWHSALGYLSPDEFGQEVRRARRVTSPSDVLATARSG